MSNNLLSDLYSDLKDKYVLAVGKIYSLRNDISILNEKIKSLEETINKKDIEVLKIKEENQKLKNKSLSISQHEDKERILFLQSKIITYKNKIFDLQNQLKN